jgi:hypothetical protein
MEADLMCSALTGSQSRAEAAAKSKTRRQRRRCRARVWRRGYQIDVGNVLRLRLDWLN